MEPKHTLCLFPGRCSIFAQRKVLTCPQSLLSHLSVCLKLVLVPHHCGVGILPATPSPQSAYCPTIQKCEPRFSWNSSPWQIVFPICLLQGGIREAGRWQRLNAHGVPGTGSGAPHVIIKSSSLKCNIHTARCHCPRMCRVSSYI